MKTLHYIHDRISEYLRWSQPSFLQKHLLGLHTDCIDYDFVRVQEAAREAAEYRTKKMSLARNHKTDWHLREAVLPHIRPGAILEFGVATGRSINHLARLCPDRKIYGFDSFQGLPEDWTDDFRQGHFNQNAPRVRDNVKLVPGLFQDTLQDFLSTLDEPIALIHIDCDLYTSTRYVLNTLRDYISKDLYIMFDEYINYPEWRQGEFKAWQELAKKYDIRYTYTDLVSRQKQVTIRIL